MIAPALGAFGKLPKVHDFVRLRISGGGWNVFEDWLTQAVEWHVANRPQAWLKACEEGKPQAFIFRPSRAARAGEIVAGVMWPSRDLVGRKFPFVVFGTMSETEASREPHLLPGAFQRTFESLAALTARLSEWENVGDIDADLAYVPQMVMPNWQLSSIYDSWTTSGWPIFVDGVYPGASPFALGPILSTIVEAARPFVGREAPTTQLGLRLPLGPVPTASASFWIDFLRGCTGWHSTVPSVFVPLGLDATAMLLQVGDPPFASLTDALLPDADDDHICNLAEVLTPAVAASVHPSIMAMMQATTIGEVLVVARRRGR